MRILHIVTAADEQHSYGGPLTVAINQCQELRRQGHDAQLIAGWTSRDAAPAELEGVPAQLFPVRQFVPGTRFSGLVSGAMQAWLARECRTFDAAHLHLARDLIPLMASKQLRRAGVRYVTQTHGMVLPDPRLKALLTDRILTLPALRGAQTRFVLTQAEAEALAELLHADDLTQRLPNGISLFDQAESLAGGTDGVGRPLEVLFLARLHPRKRVMDFARAARTLLGEDLNVRFSIVGPDGGDLAPLLAFLSDNSHLAGRLQYEGPLAHHHTMARMARADIYVLPSVDEPFGVTLLEALAAGTPAMCTTGCGLADELGQEGAVRVTAPGPEALAAGLRSLITSAQEREELAAAGRDIVRLRFSMVSVSERLLAAYGCDQKVPA